MRLKFIFFLLTLLSLHSTAQVTENFSDGDFTTNPAWTGNGASFIVNAAFQLQSNSFTANTSYYLSTASTKATGAQWDFYCQLAFNTSSVNYTDVYLIASDADISNTNTSGYFVRIGNTEDEISLYRKDAGAAPVKIIDGLNGTTNSSSNFIKVRVTRSASNQFTLLRDLTGSGSSYTAEGIATDATYTSSAYFGILVRQSTSSFFQKHFFDDILVQDYVPDVTPPAISQVTVNNANSLDVLFTEALAAGSVGNVANYVVNNGVGIPSSAALDGSNPALLHLSFSNNFPAAVPCNITINAVTDIAGNALVNGTSSFTYFPPYSAVKYDVLIDEIMADETPAVGLPEREWVELKNTTTQSINLQGWRLKDATGQSGPMPNFTLAPGAYAILCSSASAAELSAYGNTIVVSSFPSLNNTGELLTLVNQAGSTIHAVQYDISWYRDDAKKDGGWSLEMINTQSPCSGAINWKGSENANGGTPGSINSVNAGNPDTNGPALLSATVIDPTHVSLQFDESLDSLSAATATHYSISNGIAISTATVSVPVFNTVNLVLSSPLQTGIEYTLTVNGLTDCKGNSIAGNNTASLFIAEPVAKYDLVINEILFDPKPSINAQPEGVDYVEIYNRSNKVIDLKTIFIANRSSTSGQIGSLKQLSTSSRFLQPQGFAVATENPAIVQRDFVSLNPAAFVTVPVMPSFPNDKGYVIICTADSSIIDEIVYKDDWHFPLINNPENVSLERINYNDTTTDNLSTPVDEQGANWHSAASSVGYGTPTYKNSQLMGAGAVQGTISISPEIISPDNDGLDDFLTINYQFPEAGYVANITLYDAAGRRVRYLQRNALMGTSGYFIWDGLSDKLEKLPVGIYVLYTEVFNLQGKSKKYKHAVVIARKR